MALLETFVDDFTTRDTAKWTFSDASIVVNAGKLLIPVTSSWYYCLSQNTFDLTGSYAFCEVSQVPTAASGSQARLVIIKSGDTNNGFDIMVKADGTLAFTEISGGTRSETTVTYNATTHRWWRIRSVGTTIYWETSSDGITWTVQRTKTAAISPITTMQVGFQAGASASAGTFIVDNLNIAPSASFSRFLFALRLRSSAGLAPNTAPPVSLLSWMDPVYYITGSGTTTVSTAPNYVYGSGITYSLVSPPSWATINATTGVVSIDTTTGFDWTTLTIRATNIAGSADITLDVWVFTPNKTVAAGAAFSTVTPAAGDIVVVRGGTYTTKQDISTWDGTSTSNRTRVVAYPGETVTFNCSGLNGNKYIVEMNNANYVELRGFSFVDDGGCYFAIWNNISTGNKIAQCEFSNFYMTALSVGQGTKANAGPWVIEYCRIHDCVQQNANDAMGSSGWARGLVMDYCTGSVIRRNRVYQNWGEGIGLVANEGCTVTDNLIWDNWSVNLYLDGCTNVEVHGNIVWSNNTTYYRSGAPASSIRAAREETSYPVITALNITNNQILSGNDAPQYSSYGAGGGYGTSVFTPNSSFGTVQTIWK